MLEASDATGVLRAPVQEGIRNGRGARFGSARRNRPHVPYGAYRTHGTYRTAFALIELLVVVAVIAILAAMLFPVFVSAKEEARQATCISNLKQIAAAWLLYAGDHGNRACPSYYWADEGWVRAWDFDLKETGTTSIYKLGLLAPYCKSGAIKSCPSFIGGKWDRPYSGYAYNASYIGGDCDRFGNAVWIDQYTDRPHTTAVLQRIKHPSATAVFADGGFGSPVNAQNYLRAPSDVYFQAGTVHYCHNGAATVAYADGHVVATRTRFTHYADVPWLNIKQEAFDCSPNTGGLSLDDSAYDLD